MASLSEETKRKIGDANRGRVMSEEQKRKISLAKKGVKKTPEQRAKHKAAMQGVKNSGQFPKGMTPWSKLNKGNYSTSRKGVRLSKEWREKLSRAKKGRPPAHGFSKEVREKLSEKTRGSNHPNWKGGITPLNTAQRNSQEYRDWRRAVYERDHFTCVLCADNRGGNLEADHILPFALYPDARLDVNNGRTLCIPCHRNTDTYGRKSLVLNP